MIKVRATENTYNAKEGLKENGFAWNSEDKVWEREFDSMEAYNEFMKHFLNPTYYGRKVVNRYHSVVVFEVEEQNEETMVEELENNQVVATFNADAFAVENEEQMTEVIACLSDSKRYDLRDDEFSEMAAKLDGDISTYRCIYASPTCTAGILI